MKKLLKGFWLCFFLPFALLEWCNRNKIKAAVIFLVILLCVIFSLNCNRKSGFKHEVVNLTAAFNNGHKKQSKTLYIVLHHTAGNADGCINDICKVHFGVHKWNSIGYHFFIDTDGTIFQLRSLDENVPHSYHYNDNSIAICLNGNFNNYKPTDEQWNSALEIVRQMCEKYGLTKESVFKHGQLRDNNTECCGKLFDIEKFKDDL